VAMAKVVLGCDDRCGIVGNRYAAVEESDGAVVEATGTAGA
jgi:hypothetical protein